MTLQADRHFGLAKETTWGTAVAATDFVPILSESFEHTIEQLDDDAIKAVLDRQDVFEGLNSVAGSVEVHVRPNSIGHLLRAVLGAPTTTQPDATNASTVYLHTYTPTQTAFADTTPLPPYTFEINRGISGSNTIQVVGAVCNNLTLDFSSDQKLLHCTSDWLAKNTSLIAKTSPSYETPDPFNWSQGVIKIATVANNLMESCSITINNNLEGVTTLNNTELISRIARTDLRSIAIEFTMDMQDTTEYTNFINQTEQALQITFTGAVAGGAVNFQLIIDIPVFRPESYSWVMNSATGRISASIAGAGLYSTSDTHSIKMRLFNTKSSY